MLSAGITARPALNAIWNWESKKETLLVNAQRQLLQKGDLRRGLFLSTKSLKIITKKLQKSYCKLVSKELQYGYSKGTSPAECEIFFFLFFGISGTGSPPPAVLLHSRDPCAAQAVSRFVCKKARPFWTSFFASAVSSKWLSAQESMTLPRFGGQFVCFSAKDIYKVWRGRGLYSGWLCGKVYSINLYTANMEFVLCFCCFRF